MKINIGGVSLEEYNSTSHWEELGVVLDRPLYDIEGEITSLISNEGLVTDMIVGGYKGTRAVVNTGIKTYQGVSKGWTSVKTTWTNNKPAIIKMIKDFGLSLQDMWAKFMKYDETYTELGRKIDQVIKFTIPQMGSIPNMTVYWHNFDADKLKQMTTVLASYKTFYDSIVGSSIMKGKYIPPEEMRTLVEGANTPEDVKKIASRLSEYSEAIGELNAGGDLGFIKALDATFDWGLFGWFGTISKKEASNASLATAIKMSILGKQLKKSYSAEQKDRFVSDLAGSGGSLLSVVGSFLNNKVLADALKKGGPSVKVETDKMVKYLDQIMKSAAVKEKRKEAADAAKAKEEEKKEKKKEEAERKKAEEEANQDGDATIKIPKFEMYGDGGPKVEEDEEGLDLNKLLEMYTQNQVLFFGKIGNGYGSLMRGVLSASYDIIAETSRIVSTIEASANTTK